MMMQRFAAIGPVLAVVALLVGGCMSQTTASPAAIYSTYPRQGVSAGGASSVTIFGANFPDALSAYLAAGESSTANTIGVSIGGLNCPVIAARSTTDRIACGPVPPLNSTLADATPKYVRSYATTSLPLIVTGAGGLTLAASTLAFMPALTPVVSDMTHSVLPTGTVAITGLIRTSDPSALHAMVGPATRCDAVIRADSFDAVATRDRLGTSVGVPGHTDTKCSIRLAEAGVYNTTLMVDSPPAASDAAAGGEYGFPIVEPSSAREVFKLLDDGLTSYTTQVFAHVTSVEPATIGTTGTLVTVHGEGFVQSRPADNTVMIGTTPCDIRSVSATKIICRSAAQQIPAVSEGDASVLSGVGWLHNVSTVNSTRRLSLSVNATGRFSPLDLPLMQSFGDWSAAVALMDLQGRGSDEPAIGIAEGIFTPRRTGSYQFWCTATDFVAFTLSGQELCNAVALDPNAAVLRYFPANTTVRVINGSNGDYGMVSMRPTSSVVDLVAGQPYPARLSYGLGSRASFYSVGMSIATPPADAPGGLEYVSNSTVGSYLNFTIPKTSSFVIALGAPNGDITQVRVPAVPLGQPCAAISVAAIMEDTFYRFRATQSVVESADATECTWLVHITAPHNLPNISAEGDGLSVQTIHAVDAAAFEQELWFDPVPARLLGNAFRRSAPALSVQYTPPAPATTLSPGAAANVTTAIPNTTVAAGLNITTGAPINGTNGTATLPPTATPEPPAMSLPVRVYVRSELAFHSDYVSRAVVTQSEPVARLNVTAMNVTQTVGSTEGLTFTVVGEDFFNGTAAEPVVHLVKSGVDNKYWCRFTAVSGKRVTCTIFDALPGGLYEIRVDVGARGWALAPSARFVVRSFTISTITPATGSWYGGTLVTVAGANFPDEMQEARLVIGSSAAVVLALSPTQLIARVSAMATAAPISGRLVSSVQLSIVQLITVSNSSSNSSSSTNISMPLDFVVLPGTSAAATAAGVPSNYTTLAARAQGFSAPIFTVTTLNVPVVRSVSPSSGPGAASVTLTVAGTSLNNAHIRLCTESCEACDVLSTNLTSVVCRAPPMQAFTYDVIAVDKSGLGYSGPSSAAYTAVLSVTGTSPQLGSPFGGSTMTITGTGFTRDVQVRIGSVMHCAVTRVTSTVIECTTSLIPNNPLFVPSTTTDQTEPVVVYVPNGPTALCTGAAAAAASVAPTTGLSANPCMLTFRFGSVGLPSISAVTPTSGRGTLITLTGVNFRGSETFDVAGSDCNVTRRVDNNAVLSTVYCLVPTTAEANVGLIRAESVPYGLVPASATYSIPMVVTSVSPVAGSVAGGHLITVAGSGFPSDAKVFIGTQPCYVGPTYAGTMLNSTHVLCETAPMATLNTYSGAVRVTSAVAPAAALCACTYTQDTAITPIITRVSPLTGQEGTIVNISGSRVTLERPVFSLAGVELPNATLGDLQWSVRLGKLPASRGPIQLRFSIGFAWVSAQEFAVFPFITAIAPRWSSYNGGQNITITGSNFRGTPVETVRVTVCGHECPVQASTHSTVTCTSPPRVNPTSLAQFPALERSAFTALGGTPYLEVPDTASAAIIDGDATTAFYMTRSLGISLAIGLDLGDQVYARLSQVRFATAPLRSQDLIGATIESSVDAISWAVIAYVSDPQPGWNTVAINAPSYSGRYVRVKAADSAAALSISELAVSGVVSGRDAGQFCPVVVFIERDGQNAVSTCTERPSRCLAQPDVLEYIDSFSPSIAQVDPYLATIGNAAQVTIFGATFGIVAANVRGVVAGTPLQITEVFDSQVVGRVPSPAFNDRPVVSAIPALTLGASSTELVVAGKGRTSISAQPLRFSELWSDPVSWRGAPLPAEGANVVIPAGRTVALDVSPPQLGTLYVYGTLIVSRRALTLRALSIVVDNGGEILVGTAIAAHTHGLEIVLGGAVSPLAALSAPPVVGRGTLAVRQGTVRIYGARNSPTFAFLGSPAGVGNTTITLSTFASWSAGSEIAIANPHNRSQYERRVVTASATVGRYTSLTFDEPLEFYHEGMSETVGQMEVQMASEVLLLTRTVKITSDPDWTAASGVGVTVLGAPASSNTMVLLLDNVEISQCGQHDSNGVPRACVHIGGDAELTGTSLASCAIHDTFTSGIALRGVRRVTVSATSIFNVRGHGVALLGGTARYNTLTSVVVAVTQRDGQSEQLPSGVYVTHPANDFAAVTVSGCEFAGFWFDLAPSIVGTPLCPQRAAMGRFQRNAAHGNGRFGLFIPNHVAPTVECADPTVVGTRTTVLSSFEAYNNGETNAQFGTIGNYAIVSSAFLDAGRAGIAVDMVEFGTVEVRTSYFVARSSTSVVVPVDPVRGIDGVSAPGAEGMSLSNCTFVNYNDDSFGTVSALTGVIETVVPTFAFRTCARCNDPGFEDLGGFTYIFSGMQFTQSPNRIYYAPPHIDIALDLDGSLLGRATGQNYTAVPRHGHIQELPGCLEPPVLAIILSAGGNPVVICDDSYRFHRLIMAQPLPSLIASDRMAITSTFGTQLSTFRSSARFPERSGFLFLVPTGVARDEIGATLYDVTTLNFTVATSSGNDWSAITAFIDPVQQFIGDTFRLRFTYVSDLARVDAVALRFDALQRTQAIELSDTVIPTYYADPEVVGPTITQPATHMYLQTSHQLMTVLFSSTIMEAIRFERILCAATGCIKMLPPIVPPRSHAWTDTRAWSNGRLPLDGEDVVIPPGMTVTLGGNTSNLRSLIVQGTLILHPRLASEIIAAYVVVFGGTLRSQAAHSPTAKITLRSDFPTTPLGVEEGRVLQPGSMLVFGTVSLTGTARTHQWLPLSETMDAGSTLLKTSEAVSDWVREDVLVVTPSLRDWTEADEVIFNDFEVDTTTFRDVRTVNAITRTHYSVPVDLSSGQRLSLYSKVGILTRNILIDAGPLRRGHQIVFGEYGRDLSFAGQGVIDSVQIRYGGFNGTSNATVVLDNLQRRTVTISKSAIHDNYGTAVRLANGATGVTVSDTILYKTVGSALEAGTGGGSRFLRNLVTHVAFPPEILAAPETPYALCAYDSRFAVNSFEGNVAAGSASEGFCVQLPACDSTAVTFTDNEAHSCTNGFFITETTAPEPAVDPATAAARVANPSLATMAALPRRCVLMSGTIAWSNAYHGVYSAVNTDLKITAALIHDNHYGIYPGTVGSFVVSIAASVIAGRSKPLAGLDCADFRCRMESINGLCRERSEVLRDGSPSFLEGEVGLLLPTLSNTSRPANYSRSMVDGGDLPLTWPKRLDAPAEDSAVEIGNVVFANFLYGTELGLCNGGKAITTEGYSLNPVVPTFFENITYVEVNELGMMYLHAPSPRWDSPAMCDGRTCDALHHVALRDLDGTLVLLPGRKATVYSLYQTGALINCALVSEWSAYRCPEASYAQLQITNMDADARTRSISPLELQDEQYLARINYALQPPMCYRPECSDVDAERPGLITTELRTERVYLVDFSTEVPRRSRWHLRHCMREVGQAEVDRAIVVRVQMRGSMDVNIWANGELVPRSPNSVTFRSPAGSNYFESLDERQYIVLPCDAVVEAHQLVNAIVTLRLDIVIEQFVATLAAQFIPRIAMFLGLPEAQLDVLEVYPGSTIVRFRVLAQDSADYDPAFQAQQVNSRVLRLLTTTTELLVADLQMPVASIDDIQWAQSKVTRPDPPEFVAGLTDEFYLSIGLSAFALLVIIVAGIVKLRLNILQHRDMHAEMQEQPQGDDELRGLTAMDPTNGHGGGNGDGNDDGVSGFILPAEDNAAPRVEVGIKSLKIKVDVSEDDEEDDPAAAIIGTRSGNTAALALPSGGSSVGGRYWSPGDDEDDE